MQDVLYLALILACFGLLVAYVRGLDRIVRSAEEADATFEASVEEVLQ